VPNYLAGMTRGLRGLRVGVDPDWNSKDVEPKVLEMMAAVAKTVVELGGELRTVTFPDSEQITSDWFPQCGVETAVAHAATYPSRKAEYGPGLAGLIELGHAQTALDTHKIALRRHDFSGRVRALFQDIDLLLVPAMAVASPTVAQMASLATDAELISGLLRYTCPFDMTGSPTITLPGAFTDAGTPVAFQFVSRHFEEELLVRAGWAWQQATDWHRRHPVL
jgi:amidase